MIRPGILRLLRLPGSGRKSLAEEVDEEIRLHVALREEAMIRGGMTPEAAREEALRRFGNLEEGRREMRRTATRRARTMNTRDWLATLWQDVRYGARQLRRSPGFTLTAVLALALGIGANTAIFSFVDALVLRPPAHVADPEKLLRVYTSDFSGPLYGGSSYPDFLIFRERLEGTATLGAFAPMSMTFDAGNQAESVPAGFVTTNYFDILGVEPAAGRFFAPEAGGVTAADPVAVISHSLWQRVFGGDPGAIGRTVRLNGATVTVIGVAPAEFAGPGGRSHSDAWVPIGLTPLLRSTLSGENTSSDNILTQRGSRWLGIVGRPLPGVSVDAVAARVESIGAALYAEYPEVWSDVRESARQVTTVAGRETWLSPGEYGTVQRFAVLLMALVGLVLLIACANVANLLLARATRRRQEVAIRLAMGAGRGRLVRQLATESFLLAGAGGVVGVLLALTTMSVLDSLGAALPFGGDLDVSVDLRVLLFALFVSLLSGIVFGLLPALITARRDPVPVLKNEGANAGRESSALRTVLVTGQVAICVVLLICASLLVQSLRNAVGTELGFEPSGVLLVPLNLPPQAADSDELALLNEILERVGSLPGVQNVAASRQLPLAGGYARRYISAEGYQPSQGEDMEIDFADVSPGYLELMRIPITRGRPLLDTDRAGSPPVAVVNQAFVDRFWPGEDPIGKRIGFGLGAPGIEVVAMTPTTKLRALDEAPRPNIYLPIEQSFFGTMSLHVRTAGDPLALLPSVQAEIRSIEPDMPLTGSRTFDMAIAGQVLPLRMAGTLFGAFGLVALTIAMIGLYGILAYAVGQRTREIGIRIALGARGGRVAGGIVGRGMLLVGFGAALGLLGGLFAARPMSGLLFGVTATDATAISLVTLLLAAVSLLATYIPARRATRVDPMVALRQS